LERDEAMEEQAAEARSEQRKKRIQSALSPLTGYGSRYNFPGTV
jgi:hypothetical protein